MPAAHAEADREDRLAAWGTQSSDRRGDVGLHALGRGLLHVRHVLEVVAALLGAGRAPEVVEGDRCVAALCEAQRQLLVEAVEAADVREDDDADSSVLLGRGHERREPVSVRGLEHELLVRDGCARDRTDRRRGVDVEAHGSTL